MPNSSLRPPGFGSGAFPVLGVSPTQSPSATAGTAITSAAASAAALAAPEALARRAQLGGVGRLVDPARHAAQREDAHPLRARVDLASRLRSNADDGVRIELDALPIHLDPTRAADRHVDLLLPGVALVVL